MSELEELPKPGESIRPITDVEECKLLVEALYGLQCCSITQLNGYDDKNFKIIVNEAHVRNTNIEVACRDGYVLKILNALDSNKIPFVEAQNDLMLYLRGKGITCPKPIKNRSGNYYSVEKFVSGEHVVRLLEFVPGSILHHVSSSHRLFYQCGKYVAFLDKVLEDFYHPAYYTHQSLWMLNSVPLLSQFLFAIKDTRRRKLIEDIIEQFKKRVLAKAKDLEKGIIHGDFNEQNVVLEKNCEEYSVGGILDFGDSQYSCYLFELAIAVTYMIMHAKDLNVAGYVIAGYSTVRVPTDLEFSLLKLCVAARMCQSLVLGAYSNLQDPSNNYVLTTAVVGWDMLLKLWPEPEDAILRRWKSIANNYKE